MIMKVKKKKKTGTVTVNAKYNKQKDKTLKQPRIREKQLLEAGARVPKSCYVKCNERTVEDVSFL